MRLSDFQGKWVVLFSTPPISPVFTAEFTSFVRWPTSAG
ncbi:MAG TPA: hypothetical protein GX517_04240 [Alicyclobacillus sp.]|nr:hypothetical protein [Alicyclobacillus sp.]